MRYAKAKCPRCHRSQWLTLDDAGQMVVCPACGQRYVLSIPAEHSPPAEPAVPETARAAGDDPPFLTTRMVVALSVSAGILFGVLLAGTLLWASRGRPTPPPALPPPYAISPPTTPAPVADAPMAVPSVRQPDASQPATTAPAIQSYEAASRPSAGPTAIASRGIRAVRPPAPAELTDAALDLRIGQAITRGCDYLLGQFRGGILPDAGKGEGEPAGRDALAVYALLQAAKAVERPDLAADGPMTGPLLRGLNAMPMTTTDTTYDRSLRAQALSVYNRPADRATLAADAQWLAKFGRAGGYTYDPPVHTGTAIAVNGAYAADEENGAWDNSNSQYGALGVWAAEDAGVAVPTQYWGAVRKHWLRCQRANGQWGYTGMTGGDGRLSMTVAGLTMMMVAEDHLGVGSAVDEAGHPAYSAAVARGLAWLSAGDNAVTLPGDFPAYTLYGLERAGLASGIKTFGRHNWYRELAARQVVAQGGDGSWGSVVDTAFNLLFLSRGRHPILFDKLQFDGAWANRPRDVANLTLYAARELERPFNWQVVPVDAGWQNWMDAPVLFIASHRPPPLSAGDVDQLRLYAENGGLIFTCADLDAAPFNAFVADLAAKLFPRYPLHDLSPDDPVYGSLFPLGRPGSPPPPLQGVTNGSRLLLVHSPVDLGRSWQLHTSVARPEPFRVGLNVFIYAAGKANYRNKLQTTVVPDPAENPVATTAVARVRYDGDWNPEPAAAGRFAKGFENDTSIRVVVTDVDADALEVHATPVAFLTGTGNVHLTPSQLRMLRRYVADGGVLLIDACGGSVTARRDLLEGVLPSIAGGVAPNALPPDHPIWLGTFPGMTPLDGKLRPFAAERVAARTLPLQFVPIGKGLILFTPVDLTTGLLGTSAWGINGYTPEAAYGAARNVLLFSLERETPSP